MKLEGLVFNGPGEYGDFRWMIEREEYADSLFIFNDNEEQFFLHRRKPHPESGCAPGGGNAVIRPFQCADPPRAAGIPTGAGGMGYYELNDHVRSVIDRAVSDIRDLLGTGSYERIFYSADRSGGLGTGIFSVADDVKQYILTGLQTAVSGGGEVTAEVWKSRPD